MKTEIEKIVRNAFKESIIQYVGNFDDVFWGWEICPKPGHYIRFGIMEGEDMKIRIEKSILKTWSGMDTAIYTRMFYGYIPLNSEIMEPDFEFIEQLLKCYESIGNGS